MKYWRRILNRLLLATSLIIVVGLIVYVIESHNNGSLNTFFFKVAGDDVNSAIRDIYLAQVSVTFIVTSLVSFISTRSKSVFWVDIMNYKLVEPRFTSFIDFTVYLMVILAASTVLFLVNSVYIYISFIASVCLLAVLSLKLIGAYFGDEYVEYELCSRYIYEKSVIWKKIKENHNDIDIFDPWNMSDDKIYEEINRVEYRIEDAEYFHMHDALFAATIQRITESDIEGMKKDLKLMFAAYEYDEVIECLGVILDTLPMGVFMEIINENSSRFLQKKFFNKLKKIYLNNLNKEFSDEVGEFLVKIWWISKCDEIYSQLSDTDKLEQQIANLDENFLFYSYRYDLSLDDIFDYYIRENQYGAATKFAENCWCHARPSYICNITIDPKSIHSNTGAENNSDTRMLEVYGRILDNKNKLMQWGFEKSEVHFGEGWGPYFTQKVLMDDLNLGRIAALQDIMVVMMILNQGFCYNGIPESECEKRIDEAFEHTKELSDEEIHVRSKKAAFYENMRWLTAPDKTLGEYINMSNLINY